MDDKLRRNLRMTVEERLLAMEARQAEVFGESEPYVYPGCPVQRTGGEPRSSIDDIIEIYQRDVDIAMLRENRKKSVEERLRALEEFGFALDELRAGMMAKNDASQ